VKKQDNSRLLLGAALAGIVAASVGVSSSAHAEEKPADKGHCVGANACKGKGGCAQEGKNSCKGHNGCKGKGFVEKTRAECDKLAAKDKSVKFQASKM
jgi:uncharacterized membrane protein